MKNKIFLGVKGVKTIAFLFLTLLMILPLSSCYNKENREEILKVYNWGDYIDEDILAEFPKWYEEQTGKKIRVIYQTFDINEVMLTKIERGHEDYDVVCPSEYIIERMLRKDLLLPIDTAFGKTPNYLKNVSPYIVKQIDATSNYDRIAHNYAVPYMWGTCGILYNKVHVTGCRQGDRSGTDERLFAKSSCHRRETAESTETEHRGMGSRFRQGDDDQRQGLSEHDLER